MFQYQVLKVWSHDLIISIKHISAQYEEHILFFENISSALSALLSPLLHHLRSHIRPLLYQLFRSSNICLLVLWINTWTFLVWAFVNRNFFMRDCYPFAGGSFFPIDFGRLNIQAFWLQFFLLDNCIFGLDLFLFFRHNLFDIDVLIFFLLLFLINSAGVALGGIHKVLDSIPFVVIRL